MSKAWTKEQEEFLKLNFSNMSNKELADVTGHTKGSVMAKAYVMNLRKDPEWMRAMSSKGWFQKGQIPYNKGKKMPEEVYEKVQGTMFKKGHKPNNTKPVGYERTSKDGYIYVKTCEKGFVLKHRYLWEQKFGSIPQGCNIQFRDGDRSNCDINNLYLITRRDQLRKENSLNVRFPKEIQALIQLKGALNRQINKKR